jgi:predicted nucleic-acid-binding protein
LERSRRVRYLLADEPGQARAAGKRIKDVEGEFWIPVTVVLELAWVLRAKKVPDAEIAARLHQLFMLGNLRLQCSSAVFRALRWAEQGLDLANALHLALSDKASYFLTFDEALMRRATKLGAQPAVAPP